MSNFTRIKKIVILIIVTIIIATLGYRVFLKDDKNDIKIEENGLFTEEKSQDEKEILKDDNDKQPAEEIQTHVVVHITGQISKPGVVTLENGSRVIDAIKKSGGLLPSADESRINLAQKLFDEDKITIPKIGDELEVETSNLEPKGSEQKQSQEVIVSKNSDNTNSSTNSKSGGGININTASQEELKTLPGIGDATSQKIIDYRESTKFSSVEDIKNVSGIGDKKFEAIKSMITTR